MYVQPLDGVLGSSSLLPPMAGSDGEVTGSSGGGAPVSGDNIARFVPPWFNDGASLASGGDGYGSSGSLQGLFGPLMGVLQQLMQMLQSLTGYGCNGAYGGYGGSGASCPPDRNERYFQNASGGSDGDPHLSFNGARWDSMASQPDLLNSNSFAGGFRIATQATPPNAKGVTWNQRATIALDGGATNISLNDRGEPSIASCGRQIPISRGQTVQVGDGESVTYEQNGSLRVCAQNNGGGRIDTVLTPHGNGVDVDVTAHDVDLGGALVNGSVVPDPMPRPVQPPIEPIRNPLQEQYAMPPIEVPQPYN